MSIVGGLGNQLFQYATAYSISKKLNYKLVIDVSSYEKYDIHPLRLDNLSCEAEFFYKKNIFEKIIYSPRLNKINPFIYTENCLSYNKAVFNVRDNTRLYGFFQSEKYFKCYRDDLLKQFKPDSDTLRKYDKLIKSIKRDSSLSIHIRRGDYVTNSSALKVHGLCNHDYFNSAVSYINGIKNIKYIYIFSDDIVWCKENISFDGEIKFMEEKNPPEIDMYLMSLCENNIISNSTFSWWGAWLNKNSNKVVIAPKDWFKTSNLNSIDIIPNDWIKL